MADPYNEEKYFTEIVFMTHTYFTSSETLLRTLIEFYRKHQPVASLAKGGVANPMHEVRMRILKLIQKWVIGSFDTYNSSDEFKDILREFVNPQPGLKGKASVVPKENSILNFLCVYLESLEEKKKILRNSEPSRGKNTVVEPLRTKNFLKVPAKQLAITLTIIDHEFFKLIPFEELLHRRFMEPDKSVHFGAMVKRFNTFISWVETVILSHKKIVPRAKAISHFVHTAFYLKDLNNFNSLFAICMALESTPIQRLRKSWDRAKVGKYNQLKEILNPDKNYSVYRALLRKAELPLVPYLALYSKDLFSLEEAMKNWTSIEQMNQSRVSLPMIKISGSLIGTRNEDTSISAPEPECQSGSSSDSSGDTDTESDEEEDPNLINFEKMRMLYTICSQFKRYKTNYSIEADLKLKAQLLGIEGIILTEKALYDLSRKLEPKK
eukprot:TRINITY_DN2242_c0_g1_i1.p1 TRINITY_DN2242_c0_g1~~TRINITY_DN2242_c0_g1_i1.p1  ORF type:complete len:438 (+),score=49.62 TRINITY_DN2242_c0_g1_i1:417-1730(+)